MDRDCAVLAQAEGTEPSMDTSSFLAGMYIVIALESGIPQSGELSQLSADARGEICLIRPVLRSVILIY